MAWPTNIVTQTPSKFYNCVNITQKITYVILRGQKYQGAIPVPTPPALVAMSRADVDLPYYDGSVTRDVIDAGTTGRGAMSLITGTGAPGTTEVTPNGDVLLFGPSIAATPLPDSILTTQQQSDVFTHTASHQIILARTERQYYDGPLTGSAPNQVPSGNLLASYSITQWEGDGSTIPQLVGNPMVTFDPATNNTVDGS